ALDRVSALVADLDPSRAETLVPATPAWTVRDLLSHLAGTPVDVVQGNTAGAASEAWTAAQVEARRDRTVTELLDEWSSTWPAFAERLAALATGNPGMATILLYDVLTHEQDLRAALDEP